MTGHPDLSGAVIDLWLGAESATPILQRLADKNVPFVVHTGYASDALARKWPSVPIIQKPATPDEITDALAQSFLTAYLLASGSAHDPFTATDASSTAQ